MSLNSTPNLPSHSEFHKRLPDIIERRELVRGNGTWVARWYIEDVDYLLSYIKHLEEQLGYVDSD